MYIVLTELLVADLLRTYEHIERQNNGGWKAGRQRPFLKKLSAFEEIIFKNGNATPDQT
jgi:hypothetical protein